MNYLKFKDLFTLNSDNIFFGNIKKIRYSYGKNPYIVIRDFDSYERNLFKEIFNMCYSSINKIIDIDYLDIKNKPDYLIDSIVSNILYIMENNYIDDFNEVVLGITLSIKELISSDLNSFEDLKNVVFINDFSSRYSNLDLLNFYKDTFRNYNNAVSLFYNDSRYGEVLRTNLILEIKRKEYLVELNKRRLKGKVCDILDKNEQYQGEAHFIPKHNESDEIIVLFHDMPYTFNQFSKTGLHTKKIHGKICWK